MRTYRLRILRSPPGTWGIAIDLTAQAIEGVPPAGAVAVSGRVHLALRLVSGTVPDDEVRLLVSGLDRVAAQIENAVPGSQPITVAVRELRCAWADFQAEGLEVAIMCWAGEEFGFDPPEPDIAFDLAANRYRFSFRATRGLGEGGMTVSGAELAGCPVESIAVGRSVILGWLDGPTDGFIHLDRPESTWRFQAHADAYDPDDLDDRLYLLSPVPDDTILRLLDALKPSAEPRSPHWPPIWRFPERADQARAETVLAELVARAGPPEVLIESKDLTAGFRKVWLLMLRDGQA